MNKTQVSTIAEKFEISKTMAQLMLKNNCATPDEYRQLRKQKRLEAATNKVVKEKPSTPVPLQKGKKR